MYVKARKNLTVPVTKHTHSTFLAPVSYFFFLSREENKFKKKKKKAGRIHKFTAAATKYDRQILAI
jgi:hypothetical protein